jgi:hypothetical protein
MHMLGQIVLATRSRCADQTRDTKFPYANELLLSRIMGRCARLTDWPE